MTYTCAPSQYAPLCTGAASAHFGGKLVLAEGVPVVTDRLGSVRANSNGERFSYFPFGEEENPHTADKREKFGTYVRDYTPIMQDYALNRKRTE